MPALMEKVIEGKRYSLARAHLIAEWSNGLVATGAEYFEESLYKSWRGNWFIHGRGGAQSKYAGGEDIHPLSETEAIAWLQEHRCEAALDRYFPIEYA